MTGYPVLLRRELLEQWRTMRLGVVVIVYLAFGLLSPAVARYTPELVTSFLPVEQGSLSFPAPTLADAVSGFMKNVGGTLTIAGILLAMGMIASEKERGTAAFVLTRPAGRGAFVAAKMTALAATLGLAMLAAGLGAYAYTAWLFEPPSASGFAVMVVLVWLAQLSIAAITLLGSAVAPSAIAAGAIGFAAYALLAVVSILPPVLAWTPSGLMEVAGDLALGSAAPDALVAIAANAVLVVGSGLLAWLALRRQEL